MTLEYDEIRNKVSNICFLIDVVLPNWLRKTLQNDYLFELKDL